MSYTVIYNFVAKAGLRDQVIDAFGIVRGAAGLNALELYKDQANVNKLVCVENWESQAHHDRFIDAFTPEQSAEFASMFEEPPVPKVYALAG